MRTPLDLSLKTLDHTATLIHGAYGAGKTHLLGDFLHWGLKQGGVRFLNIKGEDGYLSMADFSLGMIGETVETRKDYTDALEEYRKLGIFALAVDSLSAAYNLLLRDIVGSVRYPEPARDGEKAKMWWGQLSMGIREMVTESRTATKHVLWVSPYDKSENAITGQKDITPDLPGKSAYGIAGRFDFVGQLKAETLGPTNVKRSVSFAPSTSVLTRLRLPRPITKEIPIGDGGGGWAAIFSEFEKALQAKEKA